MSDVQPLTRQQLAEMIDDHDDAAIEKLVNELGPDQVLDQVFEQMGTALTDKAANQEAVVQWDITLPDSTARTYTTRIENGSLTSAKEPTQSPRVTLGLGLADFLRLVAGKLDGVQAFLSGRLKLKGDILFAQSLQGWFA
jgi:putative sterol carrier protein